MSITLARRCLHVVAAFAVVVILAGCNGHNLQIVRAPFISPVVIPGSDNIFYMNVAVKNMSGKPHDPVFLWIKTEYFKTPSSPTPCGQYDDFVEVPALAAGESWALTDYRMDRGDAGCPCMKNLCDGHVWLKLVSAPAAGPALPGPGTEIHVDWAPSGDLADMTITSN